MGPAKTEAEEEEEASGAEEEEEGGDGVVWVPGSDGACGSWNRSRTGFRTCFAPYMQPGSSIMDGRAVRATVPLVSFFPAPRRDS